MGQQKKNSGCMTAAIILGVLVLVAVAAMVLVGVKFCSGVKTEHRIRAERAEFIQEARREGMVVFQEGAIPQFAPHRRGEALKREQFVALMIDDMATELARKELQETANGSSVKWLLQTGDIFDRNGVLHGHFTLPYEIRSGHSTRGSSVSMNCEFLPESKEALLKVRRGDWVTVEGTLSFDGQKAEITEARIVDEKTAPRAEQP